MWRCHDMVRLHGATAWLHVGLCKGPGMGDTQLRGKNLLPSTRLCGKVAFMVGVEWGC